MGVISRSYWEAINILLGFVSAVFQGLVLRWMRKNTRVIKRNLQADDEFYDNMYTRVCKGWRLTIWITEACVFCFLTQTLTGEMYRVLFFALCHDCHVRKGLWFFSALCGRFGYVLMFLAHFERLRFTFKGTTMRLPHWAPKVVYGTCVLFTLIFFNVPIFRNSHPSVASALIYASIFLYVTAVCVLTLVFYNKTIAAANRSHTDRALLEVAVRITVIAGVSMISSTITYLVFGFVLSICPMCYFWLAICNALVACDMCLNTFCLMCTFSFAVGPYMRVFGRLHSAFTAHVTKSFSKESKTQTVLNRVRSVTVGDDKPNAANAPDSV